MAEFREEAETVRDISGRWFDAGSYIDPVFQVGPSSSDEAGGVPEIPNTNEQSFVENAGGRIQAGIDEVTDAAQQTYDKIYNGVNDAANAALDSFDSPGGGDFFS